MSVRLHLVSNLADGVLAAGGEPLRLSWKVAAGPGASRQDAYEIHASRSPSFDDLLATTGVVEADRQILVTPPGEPLASREVRFYRARIRTAEGWSDWSEPLAVEAGLLRPSDWVGSAITLPHDAGAREQSPVILLRKTFSLPAEPVRARLHVTSYGVHRVRLNGKPVSENLLDPGWTSYRRRLLAITHDVTSLLRKGENVLAAMLGDGWYRGRLGGNPKGRCWYGDQLALLAQLEVELADGQTMTVPTDDTWRVGTGEVRRADLYDGCHVDLRHRQPGWDAPGFDDSTWQRPLLVHLDTATIEPQIASPVRPIQTFPLDLAQTKRPRPGLLRVDAGQNVAGFVRLTVEGTAGQTVTVRHAEVLEPDGSLHLRSLRTAKATDTYVLADDHPTVLEPVFTFHGFRYAEVETDATVHAVEVVAISSALTPRSEFSCSDPTVTRLHENVRWSQRDNFVAVPTDCPQRDERLGWTGDAQAFASTACTLFDSRAFWSSWLRDLALDQEPDGGVASVVPNYGRTGVKAYGRAGWADAATIVPWAVYESYADADLLRRQLPSMVAWVGYLEARRRRDDLLGGEEQYGDWLDPDAPSDRPSLAKVDADFLANAFFAHSAQLVARTAHVLGETDLAARHAALGDEVAAATWQKWADHIPTTQTGCAVAICFDIAPADQRQAVGDALARLVREGDGRIATGFLGTPLVLPALTATGHVDEAYLMLLRRETPSWLYQVEQGATTVWERWDAIRPDGTIHDGRMARADGRTGTMLSFNHYAYGAVMDWIYRTVAGIAPAAPGYAEARLEPRPVVGISWARAAVETPYGRLAVRWSVGGDASFEAEYDIPYGVRATFVPPATTGSSVLVDGEPSAAEPTTLSHGHHQVQVTRARLARPRGTSARH
ncbi:MAG TPA: family 78 glycoside hydrolase catalytic domain [Actinopolymorphaceae bacterium]